MLFAYTETKSHKHSLQVFRMQQIVCILLLASTSISQQYAQLQYSNYIAHALVHFNQLMPYYTHILIS